MKKVRKVDRASVKHLAALESNVFKDHMAVLEALALLQYEDGSPRAPGRLFVEVRGAAWKFTLKDPDSECQLVVEGNSADDALDTLALLLGSEDTVWEPDPWARRNKGRKSSK